MPLPKSQNPDFGFPEGRLHRRKGLVFVTDIYIYIYICIYRDIYSRNVRHFPKMSTFSKFQNLKIEMLEYVWEQFPHIQKIRSQKILLS